MLMALVTAARGQELKVLFLDNMVRSEDKVKFIISERTKTRKYNPLRKLEFMKYIISQNLDLVACLDVYIIATQTQRTKSQKQQLLICYQSPHKPVSTTTIARWLKTVMAQAGICTDVYSAHSTRSASTSKATSKGVSTRSILKQAYRTNALAFKRLYDRSDMFQTDNDLNDTTFA